MSSRDVLGRGRSSVRRMWTGASQRSGTVQGAVEHLGINMLDRMMASSALSQNGRLSGARVARELELVQLSN